MAPEFKKPALTAGQHEQFATNQHGPPLGPAAEFRRLLDPSTDRPWWVYQMAASAPDTKPKLDVAGALQTVMSPPTDDDIRQFFTQPQQDKLPQWLEAVAGNEEQRRRVLGIREEIIRMQRGDMRRQLRERAQAEDVEDWRQAAAVAPTMGGLAGGAARLFALVGNIVPDRYLRPETKRVIERAERHMEKTSDRRTPWRPGAPWKSGGVVVPGMAPSAASDTDVPLTVRANNPGALRSGGGWEGNVGETAGFAVYESPEWGFQAMIENLETRHIRYGDRTIDDMIRAWAPTHENPTNRYIRNVRAVLRAYGAETRRFNSRDIYQATVLAVAIGTMESQEAFPWTKESLVAGLRAARSLQDGQRGDPIWSRKQVDAMARQIEIRDGVVTIGGKSHRLSVTGGGRLAANQ